MGMVAGKRTVLVADDDVSLRFAIGRMLKDAGYGVCEAANGREAYEAFSLWRPDLVVLDVMMPEMDGFEVCDRIRKSDALVPILFLSAKGDAVDKRMGYRLGADDYLVKPFGEEDLLLRVGALLRRSAAFEEATAPAADRYIVIGDLSFDLHVNRVTRDGQRLPLTPKESEIACFLARHAGDPFTSDELIEAVWGSEYLGTSISVPVYIRKIRAKIEPDPSNPTYLQTVWGYGYRIVGE